MCNHIDLTHGPYRSVVLLIYTMKPRGKEVGMGSGLWVEAGAPHLCAGGASCGQEKHLDSHSLRACDIFAVSTYKIGIGSLPGRDS